MSTKENSTANLQQVLFDRLKNRIQDNIALMDVLSELLNVSSDGIYRRMRGDKLVNLDELIKICRHFDISLDEFVGLKKQSLQFNYTPLDLGNPEVYKSYMRGLLDNFSDLSRADDKEVFFTAIDIPMFHFLPFLELTLFKVFSWSNSTGAFQGKYGEFCSLIKDDELVNIYKNLTVAYNAIPSVEIWTEGTLVPILRSIDYYFESGYFASAQEALLLCNQLLDMIAQVSKWSNHGYKDEHSQRVFYKLYLSGIELENNFVVTRRGKSFSSNIKLYTINSMSTTDPDFCDESLKWINNTIKKSILISGGLQKESFKFFNSLNQNVRHLIERIENTKNQNRSSRLLF